jgi:hydrogenase maturation protease
MKTKSERYDNRIVVIGFGNSLRGDDAVGRRVVEQVSRKRSNVVAVSVTQLVPELATLVASARAVIFVDACVDARDGVEVRELTPACPLTRRMHDTGPRELLALSRSCYSRAPMAWLVAVPARKFGYSEKLSAEAEQHAAMALREVESLIDQLTAQEVNHA